MEGRVLRSRLEIIVITVIKIHGLFALEHRGKGIPPTVGWNAAIHSLGLRGNTTVHGV